MKKIVIFAAVLALVASCKDKDVFDAEAYEALKSNTFNFATIQEVNLSVDYSAYHVYGPVFFSVYAENPFEGSEESIKLKQNVKPVFEAYTDAKGKFNESVKLPAYAQDLYVVTGNFFVAENLLSATVKDGQAQLVAGLGDDTPAEARRSARASKMYAPASTSLETLYQLSYEVDVKTGDKTDVQVYKEWMTPLGSWDSESGRPNYLLDKSTADPRLYFTDEEMEGLYETVANALVANETCQEDFRKQADLTVERESEISVAFLGSMTCWNNTLGYYYYNDTNKPTVPMDLNIIMLLPNTQDGHWKRDWCTNPKFYGNIAMNRGDVVKLMYYPNIANGDLSGATSVFPKGTKIGFIIKSNGWGMQKTRDGHKFFNSYNGLSRYSEAKLSRQYNVWGASTDGLSYCNTTGLNKNDCEYQNPEGQSRTAKFAYKNADGEEYAIVGFEDACNDLDYDDIVLALRPADAFKKLPEVEEKKTSSSGIYAFEDLWPSQGDYDMNDAMVEVTHEKTYSITLGSNDYKIKQETFMLTTYQNYVTIKSGLALTLDTKEAVSSIVMKKVDPETKDTTVANFIVDGNNYLLTDDITGELGTTYILEVNYKNGFSKLDNAASIKPFIYRTESEGRWEVHIPFEAPTDKMIYSYFGTLDDRSVPSEGKFFVRDSDYPFAFYLDGVTIESFKETLLKRENEKVKISTLYPFFLPWVKSKGAEYADWYLHPSR